VIGAFVLPIRWAGKTGMRAMKVGTPRSGHRIVRIDKLAHSEQRAALRQVPDLFGVHSIRKTAGAWNCEQRQSSLDPEKFALIDETGANTQISNHFRHDDDGLA
jgi:hypothetical protein